MQSEPDRLAALRALNVLDTPPEPFFDAIVAAAAQACGAPIALVSLVDADRQWFKARCGLEVCETGRDVAFCDHVVRNRDLLVVPDAASDPRFADNPLVTGPPHVAAYAGAPLSTPEGHILGTLCVIHHQPTRLDAHQIHVLESLAAAVAMHLETRRAALMVRDSEALMRGVVAQAPVALVMLDRRLRVVEASTKWAQMSGIGRVPVGERYVDLMVDRADRFVHVAERALAGETLSGDGLETLTATGARIVVRWEMRPWLRDDGGVGGVLFFVEDITAEYDAIRELEAEKARLDRALRLGRAAAWEYSPSKGKMWVSETFSELFCMEHVDLEALAQEFWDMAHPEDLPLLRAAWEAHRAGGPPLELDHRVVRLDGAVIWVRSYLERKIDPKTGRSRRVGFFSDITARKEQEVVLTQALQEAEAATRAKSDFLANMSHEIRTPLNGVTGVAGALARTPLSPPQAAMVQLIQESGQTLERLLGDLLDLSKVEAGRLTLETEAFDPVEAVEGVAQLMRPRASQKGLELRIEAAAASRRPLLGDVVRLKQIAANLISNAIKFTEMGGVTATLTLTPTADGEGAMLELAVIDTGIGIEPQAMAGLFGRFVQADASITRRFGGTGLGLAISRSLAELMGGGISVSSSPGAGSTFRFTAPFAYAEDVAVGGPLEAGDAPTSGLLQGLRGLLAEDNLVNQQVVRLILEPFGVQLEIANDGAEAIAAFTGGARFDIVLMDMQMPGVDGLTAIREIRRLEAAGGVARTPILVLSANAMSQHRDAAFIAGADGFVAKPITPQRLVEGLCEALALSQGEVWAA